MEWGYAVYPHFITCNRNFLVVKYSSAFLLWEITSYFRWHKIHLAGEFAGELFFWKNGKSKQRRNTCFASV